MIKEYEVEFKETVYSTYYVKAVNKQEAEQKALDNKEEGKEPHNRFCEELKTKVKVVKNK